MNPGDVLAQKFRLLAPLGAGGMGTVWRAEHLALRSQVAVKIIHSEIARTEGAAERFLREAQAAAALRSPHVVQVLDFGVDGGTSYIVMELLDGESLAARLRRVGRLSPEETLRVVTHVARALGKAHEMGVVHRDLKPDNVFLVRNVDDELVKVLDFGIAKMVAPDAPGALTHTGAVLGSPHYMSPEQARGRADLDYRADLWSLGIIAFQCATGRLPFESDVLGDLLIKICGDPIPAPSTFAPVLPGFDAWFLRAVARDPAQRFQSAMEMAEALRALSPAAATQPPVSAPLAPTRPIGPVAPSYTAPFGPVAPSHTAPLPAPAQPRRASIAVIAVTFVVALVFAVVLIGGGAFFYFNYFASSEPTASASTSAEAAPPLPSELASVEPSAVPLVSATGRVASTGKSASSLPPAAAR